MSLNRYVNLVAWVMSINTAMVACWIAFAWVLTRLPHVHP